MVKVLVLFYSTYGHLYQMAQAIADGAREVEGAEVVVKRIEESLSAEVVEKMGAIEAQKAFAHLPIVTPQELPEYDAIIFGTPTRFGTMAAQLKNFLDGCGQLWMKNALEGKVASIFASSGTQHGGNEATILCTVPALLHLGMVYVGLPYTCKLQMGLDMGIQGGTPYGATTISGPQGERMPSEEEKAMGKFQGRHVTEIAKKLSVNKENGKIENVVNTEKIEKTENVVNNEKTEKTEKIENTVVDNGNTGKMERLSVEVPAGDKSNSVKAKEEKGCCILL